MLTLGPGRLADLAIPIGTGWILGACMEARGKQDLWLRQKPEVLGVLREQAIILSAIIRKLRFLMIADTFRWLGISAWSG